MLDGPVSHDSKTTTMYEDLQIIKYPDPRLKAPNARVETFDENLKALAARMFELMREAKGVGLAAPQVGVNLRLFVMNHSGEPGDDRVYANPTLTAVDGETEGEEGCLSLPDIHIDVLRADKVRLQAQDVDGKPVDIIDEGFVTRVWQHETDHLDAILLTDRMGFSAKMKFRKKLKELEERFAALKKKR
ncbi:MAG: peptide deformylase [Tepidisphaeraceae bacterium]